MSTLGRNSLLTIWAMPKVSEVPLFIKAKELIDNKFNGPDFPIHMTLVGQLNTTPNKINHLEKEISNELKPIEISYKGYGMKDYLFQAFYVKVELNKDLKTTRSKICNLLKLESKEFMPHLSLYYGKRSLEEKQPLLTELPKIEGSFIAQTLFVVSFDPKNIEWKILNSIHLKGS